MTFQFPYIHILNLKEKEKEQAFSEFGLLVRKKETVVEELNQLIQERDARLTRWESPKGPTSVTDILLQNQYLDRLDQMISAVKEKLFNLEAELTEKQEKFLEKQKDEKMWTHLRDKAFEAFQQKEKKEEQDRLDEMATIRHFHQRFSH